MKADFALDYDVLTIERPHKLYLLARLVSGPALQARKRRPLNLSLVLDRSGSMAGDKLDYTRQAARFLVQNLTESDLLSVVLYNESVETLLQPEPVIHKDSIIQRLNDIKASGMTNLSGGWLQGCALVEQNATEEFLNRVILISDGLANRGIVSPDQIINLVKQKRARSVTTTAMGLGKDFNEDLMMAMADAGGGAYYFIESPESAPAIFQEELRGLLNVVGQNLTISVVMTDHITHVSQLNAYNMHMDGQRASFSLGDVFANEVKTLVLELSIPALSTAGQIEIATLCFEYDAITEQGSKHQHFDLPIIVNLVETEHPVPAPDVDVRRSVLLLQAARARREAISAADTGDYGRASQVLRQIALDIEDSQIEHHVLNEERQALLKQAEEMRRGADYYDSYNRKSMSTQAMYTMIDRHESTQSLRMREVERLLKQPETEKKPGVTPTHLTWREQSMPLNGELFRVGRAPQNEIVMDAKNISRFHCQIKRVDNLLILEDLGSTNGTYVNEMRLTEPHVLSVGDVARIGYEQLIFHDQG